jgi:hypothetical protein
MVVVGILIRHGEAIMRVSVSIFSVAMVMAAANGRGTL